MGIRDWESTFSSPIPVLASYILKIGVVYTIWRGVAQREKESVIVEYRAQLASLSIGKGCTPYSKPAKIDVGVVEQMLSATRDSAEGPC